MKIENNVYANIFIGLKVHYNDTIFPYDLAYEICQEYVGKVGLCVTFTKTEYIYTNGNEPGLIIGLINYPRFPSTYNEIYNHAINLGKLLMKALGQYRVSIMMNDKIYMLEDEIDL